MEFEQVWAEEGGVSVGFERVNSGCVRVWIDTGGAGKISATIADYRWNRIVKKMALPADQKAQEA